MSELNQHTTLVLVPAYNAAGYLPELIVRIKKYVCDEHLLIIDDGSTDESAAILKEHNVKHISFGQNRGKGAALMAGFEYAIKHGYRSVLTIDADLQHLPEEMPRFFALDNGRRVVIGTRHIALKDMPFARWLSNNLTSLIISIFSSQRVRDSQSGFRLIPVSLLKAIQLKTVNYDFESEILFKAGAVGCTIIEAPITTVYEGSHSYINPLVDTLRFIRQIFKRVWG
jgi:glycosyltransferase involved in cell wall biosynthesis